jgi:hypothetical protein
MNPKIFQPQIAIDTKAMSDATNSAALAVNTLGMRLSAPTPKETPKEHRFTFDYPEEYNGLVATMICSCGWLQVVKGLVYIHHVVKTHFETVVAFDKLNRR